MAEYLFSLKDYMIREPSMVLYFSFIKASLILEEKEKLEIIKNKKFIY